MRLAIDRETFDEADYMAFDTRLRACLDAMEELLARPGFGAGPLSLGAEVELDVVDDHGDPCLRNREILQGVTDPRVTLEIDRFNLEINASPVPLAGSPFGALGSELSSVLGTVRGAAAREAAHPLAIAGAIVR